MEEVPDLGRCGWEKNPFGGGGVPFPMGCENSCVMRDFRLFKRQYRRAEGTVILEFQRELQGVLCVGHPGGLVG